MQRLTLKNNFVVNVQSDEQIILWNHVQNLIPYTRITPLFYCGIIVASEFTVYAATKLYLALELEFFGAEASGGGAVELYDETDTYYFAFLDERPVWDETLNVLLLIPRNIHEKNHYFSWFDSPNYVRMKFIGYRLDV